jgi:branched-chain amino acid transport system permease protein
VADFVQLLIIGLLAGGIYVAIGVGFSLVWGVLNVVNLAHGALVIIGAFVTWQLYTAFGIDPFLTLPINAVVLFAVGYLVQRGVINRVIRAPLLFTFLVTFGLNLIAINVLLFLFKSDFRSVTPAYSGQGLELGPIVIPYVRLAALVIALLLAAALAVVLNRTRTGSAIQAVAADRDAAQLVGIDLRHTYAVTYGLAAACAGVAGGLIAMMQAITPTAGEPYTLQAFVVVILGGLGRVSATVVGGLVFGLIESFGQSIPGSGSVFANAIAFGVMVLVLVTRPQGLLGRLK